MSKVGNPDPVAIGENLTYTVTVSNAGPTDALVVTANDPLPENASFAGFVSISQGSAIIDAGEINASFGTIPAGGNATLVYNVTVTDDPPDPTLIVNTVTVDSETEDPDPTNNSATATNMVLDEVSPPQIPTLSNLVLLLLVLMLAVVGGVKLGLRHIVWKGR